jgi:hypothetical protein
VPWGITPIAKYAMAAQRHMQEFGTTIEQFANIAVDTRFNTALNPLGVYRDPTTVVDVAAARVMAYPVHQAALLRSKRRRRCDRSDVREPGTFPPFRCGSSPPGWRRT